MAESSWGAPQRATTSDPSLKTLLGASDTTTNTSPTSAAATAQQQQRQDRSSPPSRPALDLSLFRSSVLSLGNAAMFYGHSAFK
ncbi:unnamed protein product [Tilletia caries]|uniref:Uncharacterized protein n=1 Tax=Tilletia caries TaxID=13290 RepID=A0ABN7J3X6_9BASI|nr:unnamed protein product [Tilletia caries]